MPGIFSLKSLGKANFFLRILYKLDFAISVLSGLWNFSIKKHIENNLL